MRVSKCGWIVLLMGGSLLGAAREVRSATELGLENDVARILFDARSGQLVSLRNLSKNDEYLKDRREDGGPFTLYSGFRASFDPNSFSTEPLKFAGPESIADRVLATSAMKLTASTFRRTGEGLQLSLHYGDAESRWALRVEVWLPDRGGASQWRHGS